MGMDEQVTGKGQMNVVSLFPESGNVGNVGWEVGLHLLKCQAVWESTLVRHGVFLSQTVE
jgi:hypothetical protein